MLPQTPSKIFKTDFRVWNETENAAFAEILNKNENAGRLKKVTEVVINEGANFRMNADADRTFLIFPIYGEIIINGFYEKIIAGETLALNLKAGETLAVGNQISYDKSDILIFEFETQNIEKPVKTILNFESRNSLLKISDAKDLVGFTGIYDGRAEGFHTVENLGKAIFGMVISGAFEFQNRLLENRDAILLWEIHELEFEALSENAIVMFLEG